MAIVINVEQRHIDAGKRWHITDCPIALAARYQGYGDALMDHGGLHPYGLAGGIAVNKTAKKFARDFDFGKSVEPATFIFTGLD